MIALMHPVSFSNKAKVDRSAINILVKKLTGDIALLPSLQ